MTRVSSLSTRNSQRQAAGELMPEEGLVANDVVDELRAEPGLNADHISVSASDGVIVLSGSVDRYLEKVLAEQAALRVIGVRLRPWKSHSFLRQRPTSPRVPVQMIPGSAECSAYGRCPNERFRRSRLV